MVIYDEINGAKFTFIFSENNQSLSASAFDMMVWNLLTV